MRSIDVYSNTIVEKMTMGEAFGYFTQYSKEKMGDMYGVQKKAKEDVADTKKEQEEKPKQCVPVVEEKKHNDVILNKDIVEEWEKKISQLQEDDEEILSAVEPVVEDDEDSYSTEGLESEVVEVETLFGVEQQIQNEDVVEDEVTNEFLKELETVTVESTDEEDVINIDDIVGVEEVDEPKKRKKSVEALKTPTSPKKRGRQAKK